MRKIYRYVEAHTGEIVRIECKPGDLMPRSDFDFENKGSMSERVLRGYYELEQDKGSRFYSGYPKSVIKKVHEEKIERQKAGIYDSVRQTEE